MEFIKYSVSADTDQIPLESDLMNYGQAKFIYDRWDADPEIFNVIMYKHEDGKTIMLSKEEINIG